MSAKTQFLKKLQARQPSPCSFGSKSESDIAMFRQQMSELQERMGGWLENTGISLEYTSVPLTDLLVDSRAFEIPGIQLHYEKRTIKFTPLFLYGQDVTGCVEVSLCAEGRLIPLSRLFMRSGKSTDWTYTLSGGSSWSRCDFGEEAFFMMLDGLLSD